MYLLLYIFALSLMILGWIWGFYWYRRAKGKRADFFKITIVEIINIFILIAIAYSAYNMHLQVILTNESVKHMEEQLVLSCLSIEQTEDQLELTRVAIDQMKGQLDLMRINTEQQKYLICPWLSIDLNQVDMEIDGSILKFTYFTDHAGYTPAFNVRSVGVISNTDIFPEDRIRKLLSTCIPVFIYPNQEKAPQKSVDIDFTTYKKELNTANAVLEYLMNNNQYFHSYLEYFDTSGNRYCFGMTCSFTLQKRSSGSIFPRFAFIRQFKTPIEY